MALLQIHPRTVCLLLYRCPLDVNVVGLLILLQLKIPFFSDIAPYMKRRYGYRSANPSLPTCMKGAKSSIADTPRMYQPTITRLPSLICLLVVSLALIALTEFACQRLPAHHNSGIAKSINNARTHVFSANEDRRIKRAPQDCDYAPIIQFRDAHANSPNSIGHPPRGVTTR